MSAKVGLALGSGGLRGMAHIGVLQVLKRENIPIDYIAGCSIGSLVGALYCAGQTTENMLKLAKHLKPHFWLDFVIPTKGVVSGAKIMDTVRLLTQNKDFADLDIPLSVVATDLREGREVIFTEGNVAQAVRASISVPGIFIPYQMENMLLVDGAVVNSTPIDVVRNMGADIVIAVDLANAGPVSDITNMFDVIVQSIGIMERHLFRQREHQCDVMIRPELGNISPSAFDAVDTCVELGEQAAAAAIGKIRQLMNAAVCTAGSEENPDSLGANRD